MSNKCSYSTLGAARREEKTVRGVTAGKTEPQLHVMNVSQGTHKAPQEHMHMSIYWHALSKCEIKTWMIPAVELISKSTSLISLARNVLKDVAQSQVKLWFGHLASFCINELCGNNERAEQIVVVMLENVSTDNATTESKCGIDFHGITKDGFVAGRTDVETDGQIHGVWVMMEKDLHCLFICLLLLNLTCTGPLTHGNNARFSCVLVFYLVPLLLSGTPVKNIHSSRLKHDVKKCKLDLEFVDVDPAINWTHVLDLDDGEPFAT